MLSGLFGIAILIAKLFPTTPTGRWLHQMLVELPLAWSLRVERHHLIFMLILVLGGQSLLLAAPIEFVLVYALDLSLYVEAVVAVGTVSVANRAGMAWTTLKAAAVRAATPPKFSLGRAARSRTIRTRPRKMPANQNDEDRPAGLLRAA